ncbi:MAG TPA: serine/threonine-protein kinase [Polyangia bacterium]|nr:serine/threonine-protein kinase [Polyangia bacterium]
MKKPVPFGKYYLLERINVGGMAEVFKAKTFGVEGFERLLAVKRILPNIAEDEEFISMFIDEAKIAVQLQHANIAQIFDLGKVDGSFFIALEYVHGRDLRSIFDRMRSRGDSLPVSMACYVMMQVCEGLDYAHNKRDAQGRQLHLIHRDISPQNVLIGYEGEVKLIDFGIAKAAGKASTTQAGILKGKFGYMSPEQVRGLPIDKRSDIFAVGIVLYELLTGERLFVGETDFSTLEKVRNVEIVPPSSYNKKIPPELERLMLKALARDPEDRYSNAIDLHDDLQSFLYSVGEFYSRKDLAAWMKKTFAMEIEEDNAKLEQYRQIAPPVAASSEMSRRAAAGANAPSRSAAPPPVPPTARTAAPAQMGWDDEELDTQIFDKEPTDPGRERPPEKTEAELFFEDEDRTVATEPPPDILEQARPPGSLVTPKPEPTLSITLASEEPPAPTPPPVAKPKLPPRRPTLTGIPAPAVSRTATRPVAPIPAPPALDAPGATPPPLVAPPPPPPIRRSGMNLPPLSATNSPAAPSPPGAPALFAPQPAAPPPPRLSPRESFPSQPAGHQPFGTGSFEAPTLPSPKRKSSAAAMIGLLLLAAVGGAGYWYYSTTTRPGRIEVTATPADATVLVDNVKVGDHSPVSLDKPPGPYTLSVIRDGYVRSDQNVEVRAGQRLPLAVNLEPSPDTGFEVTSEPPGGLVWLDGAPIKGASGQQARTDFRAFRITPGHHVLEIKGEDRFRPWRQDVDVQPGAIQKVHALLVPAAGGATSSSSRTAAAAPPAAASSPRPAPTPPAATGAVAAADSGARHTTGGGGGAHRRRAHDSDGDGESAAGGLDDVGKPAEAAADCSITVNSVPWSEVWIDGKNTTQHTPLVDYKVPCGKHKLSFKRTDMQIDHTENITVRAGGKFKQRYTLATDE